MATSINKPLCIAALAAVGLAITYGLQTQKSIEIVNQVSQPLTIGGETTSLDNTARISVPATRVEGNVAPMQQQSTQQESDDELLAAIKPQEDELKGMIQEYDQVRSDPSQRAEYIQQMEGKLAQYSMDVLPIALAIIERENGKGE